MLFQQHSIAANPIVGQYTWKGGMSYKLFVDVPSKKWSGMTFLWAEIKIDFISCYSDWALILQGVDFGPLDERVHPYFHVYVTIRLWEEKDQLQYCLRFRKGL